MICDSMNLSALLRKNAMQLKLSSIADIDKALRNLRDWGDMPPQLSVPQTNDLIRILNNHRRLIERGSKT